MLLKNNGTVKAIMGCGQFNLVVEAGETKDIPEPLVQAFQSRFPDLVNAEPEAPPSLDNPHLPPDYIVPADTPKEPEPPKFILRKRKAVK